MGTSGAGGKQIWVIGGLVVALLCCLAVAVGAGTAGLIVIARQAAATLEPVAAPTRAATTPPLSERRTGEAAPAEALLTLDLLSQIEVPIADPLSLAERLSGVIDPPEVLALEAQPIPPGTRQTFWASNVDTDENFRVEAELAYATDHVYFWVDTDVSYDRGDVRELVDRFEQDSYPTTRSFFGSEWSPGVDGDPHLFILYARGLGFSVAGYYSSKDQLAPVVHEYSNGHEMFYLNADTMELRGDFADGVLTHEFQHMIHFYRDRNEQSWMNEGFSELAAFLGGYDLGGSDYAYTVDTDITLTYWPSPPDGAHYGQAFLFLAYVLDRFGAEATRTLVGDTANGLDSIDQLLESLGEYGADGEPIRADEVYRDWATALLLQDGDVAEGQYAIDILGYSLDVGAGERIEDCPAEAWQSSVSQYGVDYIQIDCSGEYQLRFSGAPTVEVVPADPHSGEFAFWSNRGDESDMTLTRAFDLRGVEAPVALSYWVWHDLEEDYDYVYLEASGDGGKTWQILRTPSATSEDPSGNSYGWAYNGFSGGGGQAEWIEETVDLSAFAGSEILLRFEYVTDAAVNGEGFLLDDVQLEAIGYSEDFESGEGGWDAQGFVRLYNLLPQTYRVVLVTRGDEVQVAELQLDDTQTGSLPLSLSSGEGATLVVIGTARHTWTPAPYAIDILP
jgi:hypothetical protein